jgi:hypothetical protein
MPSRRAQMGRREVMRGLGAGALLAVVAPASLRAAIRARPSATAAGGHFLTAAELDTLRAVTTRLLPGPHAGRSASLSLRMARRLAHGGTPRETT